MSTRAQQKDAARQVRAAAEAAELSAALRRRALIRLGVVVVAAAAFVALVIVLTRPKTPEPVAATQQRADVSALFAGLPQDGLSVGSPTAPATLTEFADLQCPFCGVFARDVLPAVVERYVRSGRVRLELKVLTFVGPDSIRAGRMAAAAARQDRLWPFVDAFYRNQGEENTGYVTDEFLTLVGTAAGLDVPAALRDRDDAAGGEWLKAAADSAARLAVQSTPAFSLRVGEGAPQPIEPSELTPSAFAAALDAGLARP